MNKSANLIMALGLCLFCMTSAQAQRLPDPNQTQDAGVQMTLTHLSVTDQTLEVGLKIINNTDHDVWVCNGYDRDDGIRYFDRFMATDDKTLVLRRRYNLPSAGIVERFPSPFHYLRLRPGQEKVESHSFTLPVTSSSPVFHTLAGGINVESAQRLAIEIGFYDEDLRASILDVVQIAESLRCDDSAISDVEWHGPAWLYYRFFGGLEIAGLFKTGNITYFRDSVTSDGDEILTPPMHQSLNGEQLLRTEVDNVSIPYKNFYYSRQVQPKAPTDVTMALTRLDVNDTNLELSYKIKNNTDHDVWVCNGYNGDGGIRYFDRFMATDDKTLVLRRRYNLPSAALVEGFPSPFRYLRLRPGQEKAESHSLTLPVESSSPVFHTSVGGRNVNSAQRLAIEIGFYDEDLRALILGVVDMAERIGYDASALSAVENSGPLSLYYRFFGGFEIAGWFKNRAWFRDSVTSDGDEILTPPMHQSLNGEQVLRVEVDNLSIPFKRFY